MVVITYGYFLDLQAYQTFLDNRLTILFYCAHITKYVYSSFGIISSLHTLTTVLNSSAAYTRLLGRLVICCLYPIMGDSHTQLLELTTQEAELLLGFIKQPKQSTGLDQAKLLKATSILIRECPMQSLSGNFFTELCEGVVSILLLCEHHDNGVVEGALCLLWSLASYIPDIKHHVSKMDNLISVLTSLQLSSCSIVSSPARSILLVLGYGNYEGNNNTSVKNRNEGVSRDGGVNNAQTRGVVVFK